jgi:hypothetical protein
MSRKAAIAFSLFAVMVFATATVIFRARSNYVLGKPGVIVADTPIYMANDKFTNIASQTSVPLPENVLNYRSEPLFVTQVEFDMLPPDTVYGRRLYRAPDGHQMMISVVVMGTDRTSIHKPQYCLIGQGESIIGGELITIPMEKPHKYDLQVMKLTTGSERRAPDGRTVQLRGLFLYWFVADGQLTARHGERMWLMGRDLLTKGLLQRWAYVAYWGVCWPGQEDALLARMKEFIAASAPEFQTVAGEPVQTAAAPDREAILARNN